MAQTGAWTKETLTLRNGDKMPVVGFGTWKLNKDTTANSVYEAIKAGYRLLDCACDYGNEHLVGEGIKRAIEEGIITREELFVTTKLWNTFHASEHVELACKKALEDLGLDYLDLYLIHFPIALKYVPIETRYPPEWFHDPDVNSTSCDLQDTPIHETWAAMEALVEKKMCRSIGVANFPNVLLLDLLRYAKVLPAVNQIEIHPYLAQPRALDFCAKRNIVVTAYSSFGGQSYVELDLNKAIETPNLLKHSTILELAKKHDKSAAQILLRWGVQVGVAVIPKTNTPSRLVENADIFSFTLDDDDMKEIAKLNVGIRFNDPGHWFDIPIFD